MGELNNIFISYRREDSADVTGRIHDSLSQHFGKEKIFADVDSIPLGEDFKKYIDQEVGKCKILLAVIGKDWIKPRNQKDGESRLKNPKDFVRIEIESALNRDIPVIPLLVHGVKMPSEIELPSGLKKLVYRNGIPIRANPDFHNDINRLIQGLEANLKKLTEKEVELEEKAKIVKEEKLKRQKEESRWKKTKEENSMISYQNYLKEFPQGKYETLALKAIHELKKVEEENQKRITENNFWKKTYLANTIASYRSYIDKTELGDHNKEAKLMLKQLEEASELKGRKKDELKKHLTEQKIVANPKGENVEKKVWNEAQKQNSISGYQYYLKKYPNGKHHIDAKKQIGLLFAYKNQVKKNKFTYMGIAAGLIFLIVLFALKPWANFEEIEEKAFIKAQGTNSVEAYNDFIVSYPKSNFVKSATDSIESLKGNDAYVAAYTTMSEAGWKEFKNEYPESRFNGKADYFIDSLRQHLIFTKANSQIDYKSYIRMYPNGFFVEKAQAWLAKVRPPESPPIIEIIEDAGDSDEEEDIEVPFSVVENVPIYPGCEPGNNQQKKECMSNKIGKFVQKKFNTELAEGIGLTGHQRVIVAFKIDKNGNIISVRARAPHTRLEQEAIRVINLLPKMNPGKHRGKVVTVPYSLPIRFKVD